MKNKSKKIIIIMSIVVIIAIIVGICIMVFNTKPKENENNKENTTITEQNTLDKIKAMENQIEQKEEERANIGNELDQMYKDVLILYDIYDNEMRAEFQN